MAIMFPFSVFVSLLFLFVLLATGLFLYFMLFVFLPIYVPLAWVTIWLLRFLKKYSGIGPEWFEPNPQAYIRKELEGIAEIYRFGYTWRWKDKNTAGQRDDYFVDSSAVFPTFVYQPLPVQNDTHMIRLLELLPGKWESPIKCKIHQVSLKEDPHYEAISYHVSNLPLPIYALITPFSIKWGDPSSTLPVYIDDGTHIKVTRNLVHALQQFRRENESHLIWADAICINQDDQAIQERSHQVGIMGEIYRKSHHCLIWLGRGPLDAEECLDATRELVELENDLATAALKIDPSAMSPEEKKIHNIPHGQTPHRKGLQLILSSTWLTRAWIVQEVSLAPSATIYLGNGFISWDNFVFAKRVGSNIGLLPAASASPICGMTSIVCCRAYQSKKRKGSKGEGRILPLFARCRHFEATKPKDKVYALLSLLSGKRQALWPPDYRLSDAQVYRAATECILIEDRSLDILGIPKCLYPDSKAEVIPVPSWVVDWRASGVPLSLRMLEFAPYESKHFKATDDRQYEMLLSADKQLLGVEGYHVARIEALGDLYPDPTGDDSLSLKGSVRLYVKWIIEATVVYFNWKQTLRLRPDEVYRHSSISMTTEEAFWRTMIAGTTLIHDKTIIGRIDLVEDVDAIRKSFRAFDNTLKSFRKWRLVIKTIPYVVSFSTHIIGKLLLSPFVPILNRYLSLTAPDPASDEFYQCHVFSMGRRIARLDTGHFGLAPGNATTGDHIFLLKGARVPIALRKKGKNWEAVGEMYVEGMMNGEKWDEELCKKLWLA
jgi:heterokaryon incompatibility protein (HET)